MSEVEQLRAAVASVRAIHRKRGASWPHKGGVYVCGADNGMWPCPTVQALDGVPELDPYDDFCPTCDAPNPWHTETCSVPFRPVNSALDGAPEPEVKS